MFLGVCVCVCVLYFFVPPGEMVEAEKQDIQIVKTPYTIHLKNTPMYFKPTMFFEVVVKQLFLFYVNPTMLTTVNMAGSQKCFSIYTFFIKLTSYYLTVAWKCKH